MEKKEGRMHMEFYEKLQHLRKQKNLTQGELANALYVSRTAVSKWESGRGYPNIESLKDIAKLFSVSVDELLSGDELITLAEEDKKENKNRLCDTIFGLLDIGLVLLLFLPLFGEGTYGVVSETSLLSLTTVASYLRVLYFLTTFANILVGVAILALSNWQHFRWLRTKRMISTALNLSGMALFVLSRQPYAAMFLLGILVVKTFLIIRLNK